MNLYESFLTRRHFLALAGISAGSLFLGCAVNPVTGKKQLMLISEAEEKQIDQENSPHQFSGDYGTVQDPELSLYVRGVGETVAKRTHRPDLPYRFVPLNATYVNAYTFPAGSVGITRGILLELESEAALAALIGHELGHVNARHTAQQMSKGLLSSLALAGLTTAAGDLGDRTEQVAAGLGQIATGALLARYSRDNEREADSLALSYMVKAGYGPKGHTELMDMLRNLSRHKPGAIELMFATHPMSDERYRDSLKAISRLPVFSKELPVYRERYMDNTLKLRSMGNAIDRMQKGERLLSEGKFSDAEGFFREALNLAPRDYTGLLLMAKCQLALKKPEVSRKYALDAASAYPGEPQAFHILGMTELYLKNYDEAYDQFQQYARVLPGNPNTLFYQGLSAEGMKSREVAARHYNAYLKEVNRGEKAEYAYGRLKEWGYIK
jgi:predicted Zn-dependent protease